MPSNQPIREKHAALIERTENEILLIETLISVGKNPAPPKKQVEAARLINSLIKTRRSRDTILPEYHPDDSRFNYPNITKLLPSSGSINPAIFNPKNITKLQKENKRLKNKLYQTRKLYDDNAVEMEPAYTANVEQQYKEAINFNEPEHIADLANPEKPPGWVAYVRKVFFDAFMLNKDGITKDRNALFKQPYLDRASTASPVSPIARVFRKCIADLYCSGSKEDIKTFIQTNQKGVLRKIFSPLKLLNPFKLVELVSFSLQTGIMAIGTGIAKLFGQTLNKKFSPGTTAAIIALRVITSPISLLSTIAGVFGNVEHSPLGRKISGATKKYFKRKKQQVPISKKLNDLLSDISTLGANDQKEVKEKLQIKLLTICAQYEIELDSEIKSIKSLIKQAIDKRKALRQDDSTKEDEITILTKKIFSLRDDLHRLQGNNKESVRRIKALLESTDASIRDCIHTLMATLKNDAHDIQIQSTTVALDRALAETKQTILELKNRKNPDPDEEVLLLSPSPSLSRTSSMNSLHTAFSNDDDESDPSLRESLYSARSHDDEEAPLLRANTHQAPKLSFFGKAGNFLRSIFSESEKGPEPKVSATTTTMDHENKHTINTANFFQPKYTARFHEIIYDGHNYDKAIRKKDELLVKQESPANSPAAIAQLEPKRPKPDSALKPIHVTVTPISILRKNNEAINTVTVQIRDTAKQSARSELYFQNNDMKKLKGMAAMEWAAKNIEEFRKIMPNKNQPIRIIKGNMTSDCVEALIIYCKYKKLEYIPPHEFKKAISDSQVERFKKKWELIDHKDDHPHRLRPAN